MTAPPRTFRGRVAKVLGDPRVVWLIAGVLVLRLLVLNIPGPPRPDGISFLDAARLWRTDPHHLYDGVAAYIRETGYGPAEGLISPPTPAVVATPFSFLPAPLDLIFFTVADIACMAGALLLLDRHLKLSGSLRAWYWVVALVFPPLFAETQASQITGFILLLGIGALLTAERRPALAGALAAVGTGMKLYPASWIVGVRPRHMPRFVAGGLVAGIAVLVISFGPVGSPITYLRDVLFPVLGTPYPDCGIVSISTFWDRLLGGVAYPVLDGQAIVHHQLPWAYPGVAHALSVATLVGVVAAALWGVRRSNWHPAFAMTLALSLGALIPGELRTYQVLPLLPLILVSGVAAWRGGRRRSVAVLGVGLLGTVVQPCSLAFPNVWTVALVVLFAASVAQAPLFTRNGN